MLQPKRTKYRKQCKGRNRGKAQKGNTVAFGKYAVKALELHWISARQIEAARRTITRSLQRKGKVWIRIFPDKPITSKPAEVRMGKGKGSVEYWAAVVKPGTILFEIEDIVEKETARKALRLAIAKLPIKCAIVEKKPRLIEKDD